MKYLDSGSRDDSQSLAGWLQSVLSESVAELRLQSGFFSLNGIGLLIPTLEKAAELDRPTKILIGSNDMSTLRDDVKALVGFMGVPRPAASLGIVSFSGAFFHPKTYHITRTDGSQAAFVGSANLTASGLALHVEAGVALDTREGDSTHQLSNIAAAVDRWFAEERPGLSLITDTDSVDALAETQILAVARPPKPKSSNSGGTTSASTPKKPSLTALFDLPAITAEVTPAEAGKSAPELITGVVGPSVPRAGFPQYFLFDPAATAATSGANALSGAQLPGGAVGLIIQLNRDSARHFMGRSGTANISIPVASVSPLRFGVAGKHSSPRAEFEINIRYVSNTSTIPTAPTTTSIQGYGFTPTETGHADIRMVVPARVRDLGTQIKERGLPNPTEGHLAFLEWPTEASPSLHLTFLDPESNLYNQADALFQGAISASQIVGAGACWLPPQVSPAW